jgi:penicillin-binding protein 1A
VSIVRFVRFAGLATGLLLFVIALATSLWLWRLNASLPDPAQLQEVDLVVPLRIYAASGELMGRFGEKRRIPVAYEEIPQTLRDAFIAAEDDDFFEHPGVDYRGLLRAAYHLIRTGDRSQGGSTITMQLARNFFLSSEKTYIRKLREILLALRIERVLSKEAILTLYLNKIYLGNRAYGVGAAAEVYYGARLDALSLPQLAMIAGLPKAPSRYNPLADRDQAFNRRNYVLRRLHEKQMISEAAYQTARQAPLTAERHAPLRELEAPYVAELVRQKVVEQLGDTTYRSGYQVTTTINGERQRLATEALREQLEAYDRRHGYRGPETQLNRAAINQPQQALADLAPVAGLQPALVVAILDADRARVALPSGATTLLERRDWTWARPYRDPDHVGPTPERVDDVLTVGDVIRVERSAPTEPPSEPSPEESASDARTSDDAPWRLAQVPEAQGALVAIDPSDGAVVALVGGYDFERSEFNRAVQARRQPGSNFKPFIYSAALASGFTPASRINDAPLVTEDNALGQRWRPENYSGAFHGPTRLREALIHSRNLVSIRLLRATGVDFSRDFIASRFGFDRRDLPENLTLALGTPNVTPLEVARGYAVFANHGQPVEARLVESIRDARDEPVDHEPIRLVESRAGTEPLDKEITYLMRSLLQDVIQHGTGRRARALGRDDLAGKTGTTNDQRDAWFTGYTDHLVATTWVGFDDYSPLGSGETGSRAALPMWMDFMEEALDGLPETQMPRPEGIVTVRIDPETGARSRSGSDEAIFELFRQGHQPTASGADLNPETGQARPGQDPAPGLF